MPVLKLREHEHIYERISGDGRLTAYQVKIRRKGYPTFCKSFDDLDEAKVAVAQALLDRHGGFRRDRLVGERTSLGQVLKDAIEARETNRIRAKGNHVDASRLRRFLREETSMCAYAMSYLEPHHWEDWISDRLEAVAASTVKRELVLLKVVVRNATRRLHLPEYSLEGVKSPSVRDERIARLSRQDEQRLFAELAKATNPYVFPAARFSLETACRRSELLAAEWRYYDGAAGTIWLPDAKNGRGRNLILTVEAVRLIEGLPSANVREGRIFATTAETLKQAFERARVRAKMPTWRWHDFRHEAISRLFEAGWTIDQVMDISGHVDVKSLLRYRHVLSSTAVRRLREFEAARKAA